MATFLGRSVSLLFFRYQIFYDEHFPAWFEEASGMSQSTLFGSISVSKTVEQWRAPLPRRSAISRLLVALSLFGQTEPGRGSRWTSRDRTPDGSLTESELHEKYTAWEEMYTFLEFGSNRCGGPPGANNAGRRAENDFGNSRKFVMCPGFAPLSSFSMVSERILREGLFPVNFGARSRIGTDNLTNQARSRSCRATSGGTRAGPVPGDRCDRFSPLGPLPRTSSANLGC